MNYKQIIKNAEIIVKANSGKKIEDACVSEVYCAISRAVMAEIAEGWNKGVTNGKKRVGYLSAEFLIGRSIYANLFNLGILNGVKEELALRGMDITMFEDIEDAALGNGGLGRLAACYLESGASVDIPLDGYGIRYRYGLFRQRIEDGFQREVADDWQKAGDPWSFRKDDESVTVSFADYKVKAVPYDMPVIGYSGNTINTLRLWQSEEADDFDFDLFNEMKTQVIATRKVRAEEICYVLYPNDSTEKGRLLRLRQEYFFTSATIQDLVRKHKASGKPLEKLHESLSLQLNDTHPVFAIPELIRLLMEENMTFNKSFEVARKVFNFTNHTIMGEALERWDMRRVKKLIPQIAKVLRMMQKHIEKNLQNEKLFIIKDETVHMANVAIYCSSATNGVAQLHTDILKQDTFKDWYEVYPERFKNVTNGITPRRWLAVCNEEFSSLITEYIGDGWQNNLERLAELAKFVDDEKFVAKFKAMKQAKKQQLSDFILKREGVEIPSNFTFDIQVKRLHEYKRQLLNAFSILYYYFEIKEGRMPDFKPTAFIFGAKAAPSYYNAKAIIKFINCIAEKVNNDPDTKDKLRVVFVSDYNVSYAEKIFCAADVSEQISTAGFEASGTGNMKFMLNGTVTLGTMDGANVEICEEAGKENEYIFGADVEEVARVKKDYKPYEVYMADKDLKRIVDTLDDGTFSDNGTGMLANLKQSLFGGWSADHYLVLHDFRSYIQVKTQLLNDYGSEEFTRKCIINASKAGKFSSDRSVKDYAKNIWKL